jgi:hypothetical protein
MRATFISAGTSDIHNVTSNHHFGSWSSKPPAAGTAQEIASNLDAPQFDAPVGGRRNQGGETQDLGSKPINYYSRLKLARAYPDHAKELKSL